MGFSVSDERFCVLLLLLLLSFTFLLRFRDHQKPDSNKQTKQVITWRGFLQINNDVIDSESERFLSTLDEAGMKTLSSTAMLQIMKNGLKYAYLNEGTPCSCYQGS